MRRAIFLTVASLTIVLTLPPLPLNAVCTPVPPAGSDAGLKAMRETDFIIWGTIETSVPTDAHGAHSFFMKVRGYFRGTGPARVEVSDYADGDLPVEAGAPGASIEAARAFIDNYGGQDAVVFASREDRPYTGQFKTNLCTYTTYGDAASSDILPLLRRVFGEAQPPNLAQTGPAGIAGLALAAAALAGAGVALRFAARRPETLVAGPPSR